MKIYFVILLFFSASVFASPDWLGQAESQLQKAKTVVPYDPNMKDMSADKAYAVVPFPRDWKKGVTTVFVGARKAGVTRDQFIKGLIPHMALARKIFQPAGMQGYVVVTDGEFEFAFMNWASPEAARGARTAPGGNMVMMDASKIMDRKDNIRIPNPETLKHPALP